MVFIKFYPYVCVKYSFIIIRYYYFCVCEGVGGGVIRRRGVNVYSYIFNRRLREHCFNYNRNRNNSVVLVSTQRIMEHARLLISFHLHTFIWDATSKRVKNSVIPRMLKPFTLKAWALEVDYSNPPPGGPHTPAPLLCFADSRHSHHVWCPVPEGGLRKGSWKDLRFLLLVIESLPPLLQAEQNRLNGCEAKLTISFRFVMTPRDLLIW